MRKEMRGRYSRDNERSVGERSLAMACDRSAGERHSRWSKSVRRKVLEGHARNVMMGGGATYWYTLELAVEFDVPY
jgi:hypothetical protein